MTSLSCEIRSAVNHGHFILKINRIIYFVSLHDFLSCTVLSVLNLCAVLRRTAKKEALRIGCEGWRTPAPFRTHDAAVPQSVETHTLINMDAYRLRRRAGAVP